jgi:hypothetical protein
MLFPQLCELLVNDLTDSMFFFDMGLAGFGVKPALVDQTKFHNALLAALVVEDESLGNWQGKAVHPNPSAVVVIHYNYPRSHGRCGAPTPQLPNRAEG